MTEEQGSKSIKNAFLVNSEKKTKSTTGLALAGIIAIAALLLSAISSIGSYEQPAIAQEQNITEGEGERRVESATDDAAEGNQSEVRFHIEEALTALKNNDTQGAQMQLNLALDTLGGTTGAEGNATTTGTTIAGTGSTDESSSGSTAANGRETDTGVGEDSECGAVTVDGTSAADDYGCPPDPDY